ncbi:receptor like protein 22 [Daucus carota subsp. sativus]
MLCHDHERSALLHFKQSLPASSSSSAYSKTASWKASGNSSRDCCSWDGVECDEATGYVIGLDLSSSLIHATLHSNSTLFSLVHLQNLNLAENNFMNSSIPLEISRLSSLSFINLSNSSFSGQIPHELSGMSKLASLDLSFNYLYGDFPIAIFNLSGLLVLNVSRNQNLSGYLPEFNTTSPFRELDIAHTKFSGTIPSSIGNLKSLNKLRLRNCYFSGSIPTSIGNMTQLTYLSLAYNMFNKSDDLSWLQKLTKLTALNLADTNLYGDLPPSLANLNQLTFLSLAHNMFNKSDDLSWLQKLTKLSKLNLDDTNLYGYLPPSFANLTQLTSLSLAQNGFVGEIPLWLVNMTQLKILDLGFNELTGQIPRSFSQLKNLEYLSLSKNNFTGTVEVDIFFSSRNLAILSLSGCKITLNSPHHSNFSLPKLEILSLARCNLTEFPYFLQFASKLMALVLRGNNIHGNIPHWIWNASNLELIDLGANFLTGFERNPIAIQSKSLIYIDINNNMLHGNLPIPPPNAYMYVVNNNRITGEISPMICGVKSLKVLDLSSNNMSGPIPQCLANSLKALFLQKNNFSGTIPQTYPKECDLRVMDMSQNRFTGEVPKSLSNCKMLQILDLSKNQMKQTFPTWLGSLPQLQVLLLHFNMFHGEIGSPRSLSEFPLLCIINLSHNALTGALPVNYIQIWNVMKVVRRGIEPYIETYVYIPFSHGKYPYRDIFLCYSPMILTNKGAEREYNKIPNIFTAIDLSSNKFTGKVPESLGSLKALQLLDLSNNDLTGPIPPSLGNLTQLESLDLSRNKLSGVIPQQLAAQLNFLSFFNVSHNNLTGRIPQGTQFSTFDNNSYIGNSGLFGFPVSKNCGAPQSPPDDNEDGSEEDKFPSGFDWLFILVGLGSGLVVGFVMGDISMDRHPWLIRRIVRKFGRTEKKPRTRRRQIIRA